MHAHRNGPPLGRLPDPGSPAYLAQRTILARATTPARYFEHLWPVML